MEHLIPCQDLGEGNSPESQGWSISEQRGGIAEGSTSLSASPAHGKAVPRGFAEIPAWLILAELASPSPLLPSQQCPVELQGGWDMPGDTSASLDTAMNSTACSGCGERGDPWRLGPWKATFELKAHAPCPLISLT